MLTQGFCEMGLPFSAAWAVTVAFLFHVHATVKETEANS